MSVRRPGFSSSEIASREPLPRPLAGRTPVGARAHRGVGPGGRARGDPARSLPATSLRAGTYNRNRLPSTRSPAIAASPLTTAHRAMELAAATAETVWRAIPGETWLALYVAWVVGSAIFVVMQRRRPTATIAWIVAFFGLPLIAAPLYFFFGPRKLRRRKIRREFAKRYASQIAPSQQPAMPDTLASRHWLSTLARIGTAYGDAPPKQSRAVEIYTEGDQAYEAIEAAMRGAREHIHLEYYIFEPDEVGRRWSEILAAKAREGVAVRVLVDALGSKNCKPRF